MIVSDVCDDAYIQVDGHISEHQLSRSGENDSRRRGPSRVLISMIRAYQVARSGRPTGCRYLPSCSEYAVEAIDRHGPARGGWLAARRISRCTPWGGHGIDPVPERSTP
jgi:putative membrane protein insertion efficiency factor